MGVSRMVQTLKQLAVRRHDIGARLAEVAGMDPTDETRTELAALRAETADVETRMAAFLTAQGDDGPVETRSTTDREDVEYATLVNGASVGKLLQNIFEGRMSDGQEAELQRHRGLGPNAIPLDMLRARRNADVETRGTTPIPTNHQENQRVPIQPVFATGDMAFLGIRQETAMAGDLAFPVLSNRPSVGGPHTDSTDVAETDGTWTAELLQPSRIQASYVYRRSDAMRFPGMDDALRAALSMGLEEKADDQFITQLIADVTRTDAIATAETFATYRTRLLYSQLEARHAKMESDIRLLLPTGILSDMASTYRSNNADDSAADSLRAKAGGVMLSAHIPAVASNVGDVIVRKGMMDDAVYVMWDGPTAIFDEVTRSGTGEIELTLAGFDAWKVIRTAGFARVQCRTS